MKIALTAALALAMLPVGVAAQRSQPPAQSPRLAVASPTLPVTLDPALGTSASGRLLVFASRVEPGAKPLDEVDTSPFAPTGTAIAAREVAAMTAGQPVAMDVDTDAFPSGFSRLPAGTYRFQAVLDRNHDYNYAGRDQGDFVSTVVEAVLPGALPALRLASALPAVTTEQMLARVPEKERGPLRAALAKVQPVDFTSPVLSAFWGRPTAIRGWVALPPGYGKDGMTYPVVYSTGGFGSTLRSAQASAANATVQMVAGRTPPMLMVYLDESSPTGTHEFADSANNGPWGEALTTEFIPWLEGRYLADNRPGSRFLTGHSSGGWATLWLQTRYPKVFGGTWPTAPDPADFHDFTNVDLYAANANAYVRADGTATPLVRADGKVVATFRQFAGLEAVLGAYGGQLASFEWVFSPKGPDGRPVPMFDRATGRIDPAVVAYWRDHYDIAYRIARDWPQLKSDLDGKIHLTVGTADTFYLDGPAHRLQAVLDGLGARSSFTFVPGRTHGNLGTRGNDRMALMRDIAWEMYAVARPGAVRPASTR